MTRHLLPRPLRRLRRHRHTATATATAATRAERPVRRWQRRGALLVGAVSFASGVAVLSAATGASAATFSLTDIVKMRDQPTGGSTFQGYAGRGTAIAANCQQWGEAQGPNSNTLWLNVNGSGRNGWWVSDAWTNSPHRAADRTNGIAGVPWCGQQPQPTPVPVPAGTSIKTTTPLYLCVNTTNPGCRPTGMPSATTNQPATMVCWKKGSWTGITDMWFWVTGPFGEGYVTADAVRNQPTVGPCDSIRAFVAAETAIARYGQVTAGAGDLALFTAAEWQPGPLGEWAGDCPKPPYVAWKTAGVTIPKLDAKKNYLAVQGSVRQGVPPRGSVVFYDIALPWGHEAISVGDGYILTTQGMDGSAKPITVVRYDSYPSYLGYWTPA